MKTKQIYFLLIIATLIFSSCQIIESTQIDIVKPAKISISNEIRSLSLINQSLYDFDIDPKQKMQSRLFELDSLSSQLLISKVAFEMTKSPRFDSIAFLENVVKRDPSELMVACANDFVYNQTIRNGIDALFSLEALSFEDTIVTAAYFDGYRNVTVYHLALNVKSFWRLYHSNASPRYIEEVFEDTIVIDELENYKHLQRILKREEGRVWLAEKIASIHAIKISDHIAPYWYRVDRSFYQNGNNDMRNAAKFALEDQWIDAARIWKKYTGSEKKILASSACYNMALACEVQGKLELAIVWINKAVELHANIMNEDYSLLLISRLVDLQKLDKQFGIEK